MKRWMRYRVLALFLVAVMLVSYLPGVNLGFAQGTKAAETWELASGTVVTTDMVKEKYGLGDGDTWQIIGPSPSTDQVMSCMPLVGGKDWTPSTEGTYTIQKYKVLQGYKDFKKFELVLTTSLKETTMEATNTTVAFTGEALDEQAIIAALGVTVKAGDEVVANPELSLKANWLDRKIQKQDEDGNYQYQLSNEITEHGNYRVTVAVAQTDVYKGCELPVDFSVVDGRADTQVLVNNGVELGYVGEILTGEEIISAVCNGVMANGMKVEGATVTLKNDLFGNTISTWSDTLGRYVTYGDEITEYGKYQVTLVYAGDGSYKASETTVEFTVVDGRTITDIQVENTTVEVTYDAYTTQDVMDLLGTVTVVDEEQNEVPDAEVAFDKDVTSLGAGEHTVNLTYAGTTNGYQPSSEPITIIVNKADADVSVGIETGTYGAGINASDLITVTPAVDVVEIAVGFGLGADVTTDGAVVAYVNLPELVDVDALPLLVKPVVEEILKQIGNGTTMNIAQLNELLTSLLNVLKDVQEWVDLGIDTTAVDTLMDILTTIQDLNVVNELTIKVTMGDKILLKDAGAYLVGAVVSDPNYNTAYNVGGVVILPDAQRVELAFDYDLPYGLVTTTALQQGDVTLGAHVEGYELEDAVQAKVNNLYFGINVNGDFYISEEPSATVGGYTQIAYIAELGNEMMYAVPAVRAYAVVSDTAVVTLEQDHYSYTFDNTAKGVTATVTDKQGNELDDQYLRYYYMGLESDGEPYYSTQAPSQTGLYTLVAAYVSADLNYVGMDVATLVINPAEASISVGNQMHTYDGNAVDVSALVESSPEDAKTAVIMAGLDVSGDFSENGWSAVYGVVNVDLPTRADDILRDVVPSAYGDGITVSTVVDQIQALVSSMEQAGLDVTYLTRAVELLAQLPDQVTVTFKEQSQVNPANIGAYLVVGAIFDPNYQLSMDAGVVVITPEVTEATLEWNYTDDNGIITTPVLDKIDFNASAYVDGVKNESVTNGIAYVFVGFNDQGKLVLTDNAADLTLGGYTQMAYYLEEVSAHITVAAPIIRSFLVTPQTADVQLEDAVVTYDGQPQNVAVTVVDMDGNVINKPENLTVTYVGVNVTGGYHSTEAPIQTGVYTVIASYVEKDSSGQLQRVGANVATLTIQPAQADFALENATYFHDGTEKFVTVYNPGNMDYVSVIVDQANNVNIVLPEKWNVESTSFDVAGRVEQALSYLQQLPAHVQNTDLVQQLRQMLESSYVRSVAINGALPTEVGTYQVTALAFSGNYETTTASAVLTLEHDLVECHDEGFHWMECTYCHSMFNVQAHVHDSMWHNNETQHWHVCEICNANHDVADHTFEWIVDVQPTQTTNGIQHQECSVCGYARKAVTAPATGVDENGNITVDGGNVDESGAVRVEITDDLMNAVLASGKKDVFIQVNTGDAEGVTVCIPTANLQGESGMTLTISTPVGTVSLDSNAFASVIAQAAGQAVELRMGPAMDLTDEQKEVIGQSAVCDLWLVSGDTLITEFDGYVAVTLPFSLEEGKEAADVIVYYVDENGTLEACDTRYSDGFVNFTTGHFSVYMITYREPTVPPTVEPTVPPTVEPTVPPTVEPTVPPTVEPTVPPTVEPTVEPTVPPTVEPTVPPTVEPTVPPTVEPTVPPTVEPTVPPTVEPTVPPTEEPTVPPTVEPTVPPTEEPTVPPTVEPTVPPVVEPTVTPTVEPTTAPTEGVTQTPSAEPTQPSDEQPQTGDNMGLGLWVALLLVSVATLGGVTLYTKKRTR